MARAIPSVAAGDWEAKAILLGGASVLALVSALLAVSFVASVLLGLPSSLDLPLPIRLSGGVVAFLGLGFGAWAASERGPLAVITSTYISLSKAIKRTELAERAGRTEPLVIGGPQRYTRNPLYFGVVALLFGWALLTASPFAFVSAVVFLLWFRLLLIPYEERELSALFGDDWRRYCDSAPMLVPFTKRRKSTLRPSAQASGH